MNRLHPVVAGLYASSQIAQFADQQPKVFNSLAVARMRQLNEAVRALRKMGLEVLSRTQSNQLGTPSRVVILRPNNELLDLMLANGKQMTWGMEDGVMHNAGQALGVVVLWKRNP